MRKLKRILIFVCFLIATLHFMRLGSVAESTIGSIVYFIISGIVALIGYGLYSNVGSGDASPGQKAPKLDVQTPILKMSEEWAGYDVDDLHNFIMSIADHPERRKIKLSEQDKRLFALIGNRNINQATFKKHWITHMRGILGHYDVAEGIKRLIEGGYLEVHPAFDSTVANLKVLLNQKNLPVKDKKKAELVELLKEHFTHEELYANPEWPKYFIPAEEHRKMYDFECQVLQKEYEELWS